MKCLLSFIFCLFFIIISLFSVSAGDLKLNNYIETDSYYLYLPENSLEYVEFSRDDIFYFGSSSTVTCALVYKNSNTIYSVSFPSVLRSTPSTLTYTNLSNYYSQSVSISRSGSQSVSYLSAIHYDDILSTDIRFCNHDNHYIFLIFVCSLVSLVINVFYIFSHKRGFII